MQKKVVALVNERHDVALDHSNMLNLFFGSENWQVLKIKDRLWGSKYFAALHDYLRDKSSDVVFISPVPLLLAEMAYRSGKNSDSEQRSEPKVWLMHCEKRVQVNVDGKSLYFPSRDDWKLLPIA